MSARRTALAALLAGAAVVLTLSGCTPTVSLDPGPEANDPGCAEISVRLPDTLGTDAKRETDAQATAAWGTPTAVILRCGVTEIGPTTKPCITVNDVDWVLMSDPAAKTLVYETFGRSPATEVIIDHAEGISDTDVLPALASSIATIKQTRQCLSTLDAPLATPTPSS